MANLFTRLIGRIRQPEYEPEYEERVEHDTVMVMVDGSLTEVMIDDSKEGQQQ